MQENWKKITFGCVKVRLVQIFPVWVMRLRLVVFKMCQCINRCVLAWGCAHECWCRCLCTSATWSVVLCMLMSVRMCFCVHGGDYRSKSVCYSWAGATAVSVCLGPGLFADKRMLRDKWFSTCQSEQKDKRWKKKGVSMGGVQNDGGFQTNSGMSRELNNGGKRGMKRWSSIC